MGSARASAAGSNQMTRAERRIIFAKLEEVYEDEERGYKVPWTDAAVANRFGPGAAHHAMATFGPAPAPPAPDDDEPGYRGRGF